MALGCLLFIVGGYHLLYQCRLAEIKSAVQEGIVRIKKSELIPLSFSTHEAATLAWEGEKEFYYKGKMYDVAEAEEKDGRMVYWCFSDENETALVEAYLKTQGSPSDKDTSQTLLKLLKVPFLPVAYEWKKNAPPSHDKPRSFFGFRPLTAERIVLTPPPKVC